MTDPVRIPADVDRADRVIGPLTARQLAILVVTALLLYAAWITTQNWVPVWLFLVAAMPIAVAVATLVLGSRDGITLDRLLLAAIIQRRSPRYRVAAPEGVLPPPQWLAQHATDASGGRWDQVSPTPLRLPADGVGETGVIDLGADGVAVVAAVSTVNFALRTSTEQESLVAVFARYLHSLTAPAQILVRAERLDLSTQIEELRQAAPGLPHPALERAAGEHADYLGQLATSTTLLRRQVLLVLREPLHPNGSIPHARGEALDAKRAAAETRVSRRVGEAAELLAPAGIRVTPLDSSQVTAVLTAACNPESLLPAEAEVAGAGDIITTPPDLDVDDPEAGRYQS